MVVGILFAIGISIGLPILAFIYACVKRRYIPFLLGVIAFVGSQVLLRLPILQYLQSHSTAYSMFGVMQPMLLMVLIGLSAGVFEGVARYIMMRFFMKQRDWQSGFLFGAGHGGIEAVLFVGISGIIMMFSPTASAYHTDFLIGGIERFFAMMVHIGLSIIVLQGVVQRKFMYVVVAIIIHGFVDALAGVLPLFMTPNTALIVIEVALAIIALAILSYSIYIKRRGVLQ